MEYRLVEKGDTLLIVLGGELDLQYSPQLRRVLLDAVRQGRHQVIDMTAVTLIDSSGLASFLEAYQAARQHGLSFWIGGTGERVMRVFQLAKLETVLPLTDTVDQALTRIGGVAGGS